MKWLLLPLFAFAFFFAQAQNTDSLAIKLNHVKQLFIDGTITQQEYQALREKILDIKPTQPVPQSIVIQQAPANTTPTKQQITNMTMAEINARNAGRPCLAFAALLTFAGTVTLSASIAIAKQEAIKGGYIYNAQQLGGGVIAGIVLMCASSPLWIAGGVEIGKANDYRRRLNGTAMNLQFSPTSLALNF